MASDTFFGGGFGSLLNTLSEAGFFSYVLPFLLIFALVYAILSRIKIFEENKKVNGVIALAVGLLALQFETVPIFFSEVFPRLGVGLAIILVILILLGLFLPDEKQPWVHYSLFGLVAVIVGIIIYKSLGVLGTDFTWSFSNFFSRYGPLLIAVIFIVVVVGVIMNAGNPKKPKEPLITKLTKALSSDN